MARRPALHTPISSRKAPKPVGPYAQAVRVGPMDQMLFVSGQIPIEVPSGQLFTGDIRRQAELALGHMRAIVLEAGFVLDEVVKCTVYLTDMAHYDAVNLVYQKIFVGQTLPARSVLQVAGLPRGVGIEVDAIAVKAAKPTPTPAPGPTPAVPDYGPAPNYY